MLPWIRIAQKTSGATVRNAHSRGAQKTSNAKISVGVRIDRELVNDCVRYAPALDLLYLNNPKCGCTTVKHALWLASDATLGQQTITANVHDRKKDPFAKNIFRLPTGQRDRIPQTTVFSVVRNPFARALSAYVDKVANDPAVWPVFLRRFGLKPHVGKKELSFADFLGLVAVAHDDILDGHFRPQVRNLLLPLAKPVFIGFVENMKPVGRFLTGRGVPFRDERMNASRADAEFDVFYDSRTANMVRKRYADDFAQFRYSPELSDARAHPERHASTISAARDDTLLRWLATGKAPDPVACESRDTFLQFSRARNAGKKLDIVRRAFEGEHSWSRLARYGKFVRTHSRDGTLRDAIDDRMLALRRRYIKAVSDPELFVAFR
jgi:hypothetical protein